MVITNAFSINMLAGNADISVHKVSKEEARRLLLNEGFTSAIGHSDTASIVSNDLGIAVEANRATLSLSGSFEMVVAQYKGPRLPEGTTKLPEGTTIEYYLVSGVAEGS